MLHVANGSATTSLIAASGLPGRTLSWADSLYDGPVPDVPDEELVRIRAAFHASPEHPLEGHIKGFTGWRQAVDDHDVHSGRADRVRMCGIDRWIGGVHLSGHGPLWRWSRRRGQLVEA